MSVAKRPLLDRDLNTEWGCSRSQNNWVSAKPSTSAPYEEYANPSGAPKSKRVATTPDKESTSPCRKSRRIANIDSSDVHKIAEAFLRFRRQISSMIKLCIKKELLEDEPAKESFFRTSSPIGWDLGGLTEASIDDIAWMVSEEKFTSVFRKWFGKSERDVVVSYEVLFQLSDMWNTPYRQSFPRSLVRCWGLDRTRLGDTFTPEDAKDLCDVWHAPVRDSEAYDEDVSADELTFSARRMIDVLETTLKPWRLLWTST